MQFDTCGASGCLQCASCQRYPVPYSRAIRRVGARDDRGRAHRGGARSRRSQLSGNSPLRRNRGTVDGPHRAGARAMVRAFGLNDEDFRKPQTSVSAT